MEALEIARKTALAFYLREEKKNPGGYPYSPAKATKLAAEKSGIPAARLIPVVAAVYYRENGTRSPLAGKGLALAKKVAKARAAKGPLARWEVLAFRVAAGTGRDLPLSIPAIRALAEKGGTDLETSYAGRGTRASVPVTRTDVLAGETA